MVSISRGGMQVCEVRLQPFATPDYSPHGGPRDVIFSWQAPATETLLPSQRRSQSHWLAARSGANSFVASIGRRPKELFTHCEKFLTVGESAWHWPLRKTILDTGDLIYLAVGKY